MANIYRKINFSTLQIYVAFKKRLSRSIYSFYYFDKIKSVHKTPIDIWLKKDRLWYSIFDFHLIKIDVVSSFKGLS